MKPSVTTDQIKRFQADGVVFLEGFFPQEYIDSLSKGIQKNLEEPGPRKHVWNKESEGQYTLYDSDNWNRITEYKNFIQESELKNIATRLLKTNKVWTRFLLFCISLFVSFVLNDLPVIEKYIDSK